MTLVHYLVVRRDMLITDVLAQLAHAAGESFYRFTGTVHSRVVQLSERREVHPDRAGVEAEILPLEPVLSRLSSVLEHSVLAEGSPRSTPAAGTILTPSSPSFDVSQTVVVVKSARSESKLRKLAEALIAADVPHVAIIETEGALAGQMTAIGLVPGEREILSPYLNEFHLFSADQAKVA